VSQISRVTVVGLALVVLLAGLAVGAPLITAQDPTLQDAGHRLSSPDTTHLFGRDTFGRDVLARVLYAGRVSLTVGVGAAVLGAVLGTVVGLLAGYGGRWIESACMRGVDILMAFPSLLLGLVVLAVLGTGLEKMLLSIGIVLAPTFARVMHSATLSLRQREFVEAARSVGASDARIVARHVLPNVLGETLVLAGVLTASAIRIEASLSFIGLGVSPPTPTWGNMIRDGAPVLLGAPWLCLAPGLAIVLSVLAFNLVGDGLRDLLDPRVTRRPRPRATGRSARVGTFRPRTAASAGGLRTSA
jgi:peptide/nickel transport system permease protein